MTLELTLLSALLNHSGATDDTPPPPPPPRTTLPPPPPPPAEIDVSEPGTDAEEAADAEDGDSDADDAPRASSLVYEGHARRIALTCLTSRSSCDSSTRSPAPATDAVCRLRGTHRQPTGAGQARLANACGACTARHDACCRGQV
jgi:hypothetical protein